MIYVTGDIHGEIFERFNPEMMPGEDRWTENDILIVLGDFGLILYPRMELFLNDEIVLEKQKRAYLESKPYEILFILGNHENMNRLQEEFPEEARYGGTVRRIGKNVFLLQNGQIYNVAGKRFFCMGGAYSVDRYMRYEGISWWPQEMPSAEEYRRAEEALDACDRKIDYVLTHTCPAELIKLMGRNPDPHEAPLTAFLDRVWNTASFSHWLYGHWHTDLAVHQKATALYRKIVSLNTTPPEMIG